MLVWSNDFDVHMKDLADVLNRIRSAGLTLNAEKCHFASNNINIFGFQVQDGKIYPDADKTKAVADWPVPRTKKQLKSFVGLTNYFRAHIQDYAEKAFPLTELLGRYKPEKLAWGAEQQAAFETLKKALISRPVLHPPNKNKDWIVMADASATTISGILLQEGDNPDDTPLAVSYTHLTLPTNREV